jgi:glyoxylase-like metal-dependent hydrolase (beta-lactamase superfamily II)
VIREIDLMHLGRDRVIAAHELDGFIVDPGPASCLDTLLGALDGEPRGLLLTHIHLDHAGASGVLVRRFPRLRVWVHGVGAPHLADPAKLLESARRLYGDDLERLWGEVAPVPSESIVALEGGEEVEGLRVAHTPGHATHHVCYLHESSGDAFVGDVAGVRIPSAAYTVMPTPPPDIDLGAWERSLDLVHEWQPRRLRLTHFGPVDDVEPQLERARRQLSWMGELARTGDRERFLQALGSQVDSEVDREIGARVRHAAPPAQLWLGLERYWRKRSQAIDR